MATRYIGIDPGVNGGLVCLTSSRLEGEVVNSCKMPETEVMIWKWFEWKKREAQEGELVAVIERVWGYVGKEAGGFENNSKSVLMQNYGALRMALTACDIPFKAIPPREWQQELGIQPKRKHNKVEDVKITKGKNKGKTVSRKCGGETDTQWKGRLKDVASELFPYVNVTLAISDALLIARYCRKIHQK